jgi:hypothetical protein
MRNRSVQLPPDHLKRVSFVALRLCLADADDGHQPCRNHGLGLGLHLRIGFAMIGAALGMAQNDMACARIGQHRGRQITGVGARGFGVAILRAHVQRRALRDLGHGCDQSGGGAQQHVTAGCVDRRDQRPHLGQGRARAVHLPIARRQFAHATLIAFVKGLAGLKTRQKTKRQQGAIFR